MFPDTKVYEINGASMRVVGPPDRTVRYPHPTPPVSSTLPYIWYAFTDTDGTGSMFLRETTKAGAFDFGPFVNSTSSHLAEHCIVQAFPNDTTKFARRYNTIVGLDQDQGFVSGSDELSNALVSSSWTVMMNVRHVSSSVDAESASDRTFFSYGFGSTTWIGIQLEKDSAANQLSLVYTSGSAFTDVESTASAGPPINENTWYHVAVVVSQSGPAPASRLITFYQDGVLIGQVTRNGASHQRKGQFRFGKNPDGGTQYWRGDVRDAIIYTASLSTAQILSAHTNGNNRVVETNIAAHWPFSDKPFLNRGRATGSHHLTLNASGTFHSSSVSLPEYNPLSNVVSSLIGVTSDDLRRVLTGSDYTLEAWAINRDDDASAKTVFFHGSDVSGAPAFANVDLLHFGFTSQNHVFLQWTSGSGDSIVSGALVIPTGSWTHIAARVKQRSPWPRRDVDIFVNGVLDRSYTDIIGPTGSAERNFICVGAAEGEDLWEDIWEGEIGDIKLWDFYRLDADISGAYARGPSGADTLSG